MPESPRSAKTERTRAALRHAALARFLEQGVAQTTVAEIAADAGVTERTFYRHYQSKHHILFSDYEARLDWFRTALAGRPPRESIATSVRIAAESFPYDEALHQLAVLRGQQLEQDLIQANLKVAQAEFARMVEQHLLTREGIEPDSDRAYLAAITAQCLTAVMYTAIETWFARGNLDTEELSRLADMGLRMLREGIH